MRYGYFRDTMCGESAYKLTAVDQRRDLALGIFGKTSGGQDLRAIGRYFLSDDGIRAEVAFVVHEENRQLGMAGFLLGELAEIAARRGLEEFWAGVLPNNRAMAGLFLAAGGYEDKPASDDERVFRMPVAEILKNRKRFMERKNIQCLGR